MLLTHTVNHEGTRRIYLGCTFSLQAWLEASDDSTSWSFAYDVSQAPPHMDAYAMRQWAAGLLKTLADTLNVAPCELSQVPFDTIAKLHTVPDTHGRRIPSPQREVIETGYMPTPPGTARSKADFTATDFKAYHDKGRSRAKQ